MRTLYMNFLGTEKRVAVKEDGRLVELFFERPSEEEIVGNIYRGRVVKVLPGMQAAFVDIGTEKHAYLRREDIPGFTAEKSISQLVQQGKAIIVQVVKEAIDTKGPKITGKIEFTGKYVVYSPFDSFSAVSKKIHDEAKRQELLQLGEGGGFIFRSASGVAPIPAVAAEIEAFRQRYEELQKHEIQKVPFLLHASQSLLDRVFREIPIETVAAVITDDRSSMRELQHRLGEDKVTLHTEKEAIFNTYSIEHEIEKAVKKLVWLENGAYILIEQTETMTVIDVNTGKFTGKQTLQDTVRKVNEAAALEIARQLRLRDIGGMIAIDFINMKGAGDQEAVRRVLIEALKRDQAPSRVFGFTALGILEVTRKRKRKSLRDMLLVDCYGCHNGFTPSPEAEAYRLQRELLAYKGSDYEAVLVGCTSEVQAIFQAQLLQTLLTVEVYFLEVTEPRYQIRHLGTKQDIVNRLQ